MEFGIGGAVDNGVTTSGKEVQEAVVSVRPHGGPAQQTGRLGSGRTTGKSRRLPPACAGLRRRAHRRCAQSGPDTQAAVSTPSLQDLNAHCSPALVTGPLSQLLDSLCPPFRMHGWLSKASAIPRSTPDERYASETSCSKVGIVLTEAGKCQNWQLGARGLPKRTT